MSHNEPMSVLLPIRAVADRTGLSAHTIRAWERRYGVLTPQRTQANQRLYSDEDVARLTLLRKAVEAGHNISQIAQLRESELERFAVSFRSESPVGFDGEYLDECLRAMLNLDAEALDVALSRASMLLGVEELLSRVIVPLMAELDKGWRENRIRIAHEHLVSSVVRMHLDRIRSSLSNPTSASRIVVTTPSGQVHEIGALIVCVIAARAGWNVHYAGPNLPAEEIALSAAQFEANAVALSIVFPRSDPELETELRMLRSLVGPHIRIIVGGQGASDYSSALDELGAEVITDLDALSSFLISSPLPHTKLA